MLFFFLFKFNAEIEELHGKHLATYRVHLGGEFDEVNETHDFQIEIKT